MNRRDFIKTIATALAALGLGIKAKVPAPVETDKANLQELIVGIGRGSPLLMDNRNIKVRIGDYEFSDGDSMIIPVDGGKFVEMNADFAIPGAARCVIVTVQNGKVVDRIDVPIFTDEMKKDRIVDVKKFIESEFDAWLQGAGDKEPVGFLQIES